MIPVTNSHSKPGSTDLTHKFARESTKNSNDSGSEYEFQIVENEEDKYQEPEMGREVRMFSNSPDFFQEEYESKEEAAFLEVSKMNPNPHRTSLKQLKNTLEVEKILKKEKDDCIAEILDTVNSIRDLYLCCHDSEIVPSTVTESKRIRKQSYQTETTADNKNLLGVLTFETVKLKAENISEQIDELRKFYEQLRT